jgi:copper chaperone CopZ
MAEFTLKIDGMHCGSCVRRVTQALGAVEGVTVNEVTVGAARFSSAAEPAPVEAAVVALGKIGFAARVDG